MEHPIPPPWVPPPVGPVIAPRTIEQTVRPRQRIGALAALAGAAAMAAGTFLPWFTADIEGLGLRSGNAWSNRIGDSDWGSALLLAALIIAATSAPTIVDVRSIAARSVGLAATGVAAVVGIVGTLDLFRPRDDVDLSPSYGLVVLLAGVALAVSGAIVAVRGDEGAKVKPSRAVGAVG